MTVADLFFVHQRGLMNTIYIWAYNVGSNLAVVASGFITDGFGWRWVWWFCAIFFGVQFLMFFFGFEETKYSVVSSLLGAIRTTVYRTQGVTDEKKNNSINCSSSHFGVSDPQADTRVMTSACILSLVLTAYSYSTYTYRVNLEVLACIEQ